MNMQEPITLRRTDLFSTNRIKLWVVGVLIVFLFLPVLVDLAGMWFTTADYSHGVFVIPITCYMIWKKRKYLEETNPSSVWVAIPLLVFAAFLYVIGFIVHLNSLIYIFILAILMALVYAMNGWNTLKKTFLPILFLVFMFPIPNGYYILVTNPLKLFITSISSEIIQFFGISVYQEGNLLYFADTSLEVAEACSGIRSLYSYLMLSCVFAVLCRKLRSKFMLVFACLPLAILVNIMRVSVTGILADYYGAAVARGFFHKFTGFFLFIIGLVVLFSLYYILEDRKTEDNLP